MSDNTTTPAGREGSLEAPTRHPIAWRDPDFFDEASLFKELERVFDICHGCRRCFSLCNAFPLLFDAIDASPTGELDGVEKKVYWEVVDHCYLCDMCYMTKCPYVPPHPWNIDFPHLMLRAKAVQVPQGRDAAARQDPLVHRPRRVDRGHPGRRRRSSMPSTQARSGVACSTRRWVCTRRRRYPTTTATPGAAAWRVATSRDSRQSPRPRRAAASRCSRPATAIATSRTSTRTSPRCSAHNGIPVTVVPQERCCGMPKLELGDLESIEEAKQVNIPALAALVDQGYDIVAPIPSCVLMFKQELPLLYPGRSAGAEGQGGDVRPVRVPDAAAQGGPAAHRFRAPARQGELPRALPPARAEHRPQDARRAAGSFPAPRSRRSSAARATTAPTE